MKFTEGHRPPKDLRALPVGYLSFRIRSSPSNAQLASAGEITPLTQKVIWAGCLAWRYRTSSRWTREDGNAMANGDGVVSDQDIFDYEPYDALAFRDTQ